MTTQSQERNQPFLSVGEITMTIGALAALPIVGDLVKTAGDITKSLAPLAQPFADVAAKALGKMLDQTFESTQKSVDFSNTQEIGKRTLTF
ncbi:hypothetical protein [Pseudomonas canadensis]|uniref:hypothetical protein n=1 Tax=Pseudomonas canadensis TaxID=915099 RepID=UPI0030D7D8D1